MSVTTSSGRGLAGQREQVGAITGLPRHLEAGALEQAGQALPQQDIVFGQNHPQPGHGGPVTPRIRAGLAVPGAAHHGLHYRPSPAGPA